MLESEDEHTSADLISMLPDEVLVSIVSLLTLKECIATSLLSRRWRYLWTFMPKLDFDCNTSSFKQEMSEYGKIVIDEESLANYVRWVDHVIALHKGCVIEDFRVRCNLTKRYEKYIDNWVNFALARKVKRLELDLDAMLLPLFCPSDNFYTFPYKFMRQYEENCCNDSQLNSTIHFKYLEKISMNDVNVNGEALEFFLSNCPILQHLSVSRSKKLSTLKIIGPAPSLKYLDIISCSNLESFELRDANLVYFKYIGKSIQEFVLKNVPLLVEIYISGLGRMSDVLMMFSSILPQLEKFDLHLNDFLLWEVTDMFYSAVKMCNLKHLVLRPMANGSLLPITNILRSSPCLETFVLEISPEMFITRKRELQKIEGSYIHLKEVRIRGYCGSMGELEFLMHLWESAGALEKIVIDPCRPLSPNIECLLNLNSGIKFMVLHREMDARNRAKEQLLDILPPRINLQIL